MAKVIVTSIPVQGHVSPLLPFAADLVRRGHEVIFYTGTRFADSVRSTGAGFAALPHEADYDEQVFPVGLPEREELPDGPARVAFDLERGIIDPASPTYEGLRDLLTDFPASVVISDNVNLGVVPLALREKPGKRPVVVTLGIMPPNFGSCDTAPFGPGVLPLDGVEGRARNESMRRQMGAVFGPVDDYAREMLATHGIELRDTLFNLIPKASDHYLQLTTPSFEYPRSDAPPSFRFIGPAVPDPGTEFTPPDWWADLAGKRKVVVVTQGTVENRDLSPLLIPALRALADLDVVVVAATGREDGPAAVRDALGDVPANVRLGGYIPFERLLPLADALITNGGYSGVHTALRHGVPMVVAGLTQDKPEVAARVEWSGVGVNLRTDRPEESTLRTAVDAVLDHRVYRSRARELQSEFAWYNAQESVADVVEGA